MERIVSDREDTLIGKCSQNRFEIDWDVATWVFQKPGVFPRRVLAKVSFYLMSRPLRGNVQMTAVNAQQQNLYERFGGSRKTVGVAEAESAGP